MFSLSPAVLFVGCPGATVAEELGTVLLSMLDLWPPLAALKSVNAFVAALLLGALLPVAAEVPRTVLA